MNCKACDKPLVPYDDNDEETTYQYANALWIGFFGGYGMFVDDIETSFGLVTPVLAGSAKEAVICHECAHNLCEQVPWIQELLKPELSHAHTQDFWEANPTHEGWDNPHNE